MLAHLKPGGSHFKILSAAQRQPNDRGERTAFVPCWALCRAALNGATSSPNGARDASRISGRTIRRQRSRMICYLQFPRRSSNIMLQRLHSG